MNLCITEIMQQVELRRKINEQALSGTPVHKADTSCAPSVSLQTLWKLLEQKVINQVDLQLIGITHHRS